MNLRAAKEKVVQKIQGNERKRGLSGRNLFFYSTLALAGLTGAVASDTPKPPTDGRERPVEVRIINHPSVESNIEVNDMLFQIYAQGKRPNLTQGLGVDGQTVHIQKTDYQVQEAGIGEMFETIWNNKMATGAMVGSALLSLAFLSAYDKKAGELARSELGKQAIGLRNLVLKGKMGSAVDEALAKQAMASLESKLSSGGLFVSDEDIRGAELLETWKGKVDRANMDVKMRTQMIRFDQAYEAELKTLRSALSEQIGQNLLNLSADGYGKIKKGLKAGTLSEQMQSAIQTALKERQVDVALSDEFIKTLSAECQNVEQGVLTSLKGKKLHWEAFKSDWSKLTLKQKATKVAIAGAVVMAFGYGAERIDDMWREYQARSKKAEAATTLQKNLENVTSPDGTTTAGARAQGGVFSYEDKEYRQYTPGFYVNYATAKPINTSGKQRVDAVYNAKDDKVDQMLCFQPSTVGSMKIEEMRGMPMVGISKTKGTITYGMFQDTPNGGIVKGHTYALSIEIDADKRTWSFSVWDQTAGVQQSAKSGIPLPSTWNKVMASPENYSIYDCAHPQK